MNEHLRSMISDKTFGEKIQEVKETHISYVFNENVRTKSKRR